MTTTQLIALFQAADKAIAFADQAGFERVGTCVDWNAVRISDLAVAAICREAAAASPQPQWSRDHYNRNSRAIRGFCFVRTQRQASGLVNEFQVFEGIDKSRIKVCPVCEDSACETKSLECGK